MSSENSRNLLKVMLSKSNPSLEDMLEMEQSIIELMSYDETFLDSGHVKSTPILQTEQELTEAEKNLDNNLEKLYEVKESNNFVMIACYANSVGWSYYMLGNYEEAIKYHMEALNIYKNKLPHNTSPLFSALAFFVHSYSAIGDYTQALSYAKQALDVLPESNPNFISWSKSVLVLEQQAKLQHPSPKDPPIPDCEFPPDNVSFLTVEQKEGSINSQEDEHMPKEVEQNLHELNSIVPEHNCPIELKTIIPKIQPNTSLDDLWDILREIKATVKIDGKFVLSDKMRELGEYASKAWDEKKVQEYPYDLLILSYIRHVCDDYDQIAEDMCKVLYKSPVKTEDMEYARKIFLHQRGVVGKHATITLEDWQAIYKKVVIDAFERAQYKIPDSIQEEKVEGVPIDDFMQLKLSENFTRGSIEELTHSINVSKTLYEVFEIRPEECGTRTIDRYYFEDRRLKCSMKDACEELERSYCTVEHFINEFNEEARFVGGADEYYGELGI